MGAKGLKTTKSYKELQTLLRNYPNLCKTSKNLPDVKLVESLKDLLTTEEKDVIEARYFNRIKWDYMQYHLPMSRMTCYRHHDRAMEKMLPVFEKAGA